MTTLFRNKANQRLWIYCYDASDGTPVTGDASNITTYIVLDNGSATSLGSPTEKDSTNMPGLYYYTLSQGNTDADEIVVYSNSTTSAATIDPQVILTQPQLFTFGKVASGTISTTTIPTDLGTLTADAYKDMWIVFISGAANGQAGRITTSSTSGTLTITSGDLVDTPSANDEFVIIGSVG